MRVRRTPAELKQFSKIKRQYLADGYPEWRADELCWDILFIERSVRGVKPRRKVSA